MRAVVSRLVGRVVRRDVVRAVYGRGPGDLNALIDGLRGLHRQGPKDLIQAFAL